MFSVVGNKKKFFLNFSQNFGKIALFGVVGSERKIRGFGILPNKQNAGHFGKEYSFPMLAEKLITLQIKERTGKEWNGNKNRK